MAKKRLINLLPQEEFDASIIGRILKWAMGTFRIIVIVTEMVVMAAFLSRFWLDAQNADLNDTISIKSAQIKAQKDFENEFRNAQKKIAIVKALDSEKKPSDNENLIASKIPQEIKLTGINMEETTIQLMGKSQNEVAIAQLLSNLQSEKGFKSVDLNSINTSIEDQTLLSFSITIKY